MTEGYIDSKMGAMTATQKKTFTRWVNYFLSERMLKINDLFTDFKDGKMLIHLLELISGKKLGKYNETCKMPMHEMENINLALDFLKAEGLKFVGIGAVDIHAGTPKLILGLIWTVILRYQIQQGGEGASPKSELLEWVNKQIAPYDKYGIPPAEDFTKSFQDGKILSALADSLQPGLINCSNLKSPLADTAKAMQKSEEAFQIPQLVDATDMVHSPDEHSNMTYISYFRDYINKKKKDMADVGKKGPRANMCFAKGKGVEGGFARRPLPFTIHSRTVDDQPVTGKWRQDFKVVVTGPTGEVPNELKDNGDGTFGCKYIAPVGGDYKVAIDLIGDSNRGQNSGPIKGSVYSLKVREPADPTKCWAEGPGLIKAFEGKPANFTVYARDKDNKPVPGEVVKCDVKLVEKSPDAPGGTGETPVDVKDNGDGTYSVQYHPQVAGKYRVNVTVTPDDKSIKDMPKMVNCYHAIDPSKCLARGPGVTNGEPKVNQEAPFAVLIKDIHGNTIPIGGHDVKVTVTGPSGPIPVDVKDENNGVYQCKYLPKEPGRHVVDVRVEGKGVKDNPFRIDVNTAADPSKSYAEGPGLHHAFDNRLAKFRVFAKDKDGKPVAGEILDVKVVPKGGGPPVELTCNDNGDGTYDVAYMADKPGPYIIHTNIGGKPIRDMPKEVMCYPGVDASKTIVEGPGVTGGFAKTELPFTIRAMDKEGKPVRAGGDEFKAQVTAPDGSQIPCDIKDNGDGTYSGKYFAAQPGNYRVMLNVNKQKAPVGKSPYIAKVRLGADPRNSFAVGRGWKECYDCMPAKFTIHAKDSEGNPVAGEIIHIVMKNVTPQAQKAKLQQELDKMDDYLRKKKLAKIQKLEAEAKKKAAEEAKGAKVPETRVESGGDVAVEIRDNGDGTYLASYTAPFPGLYKCQVTLGQHNENIKESPKDIPCHLTRPKIVYWKHTFDAQKKRLEAAEQLLQKHGLSLPPDA